MPRARSCGRSFGLSLVVFASACAPSSVAHTQNAHGLRRLAASSAPWTAGARREAPPQRAQTATLAHVTFLERGAAAGRVAGGGAPTPSALKRTPLPWHPPS